MEAQKNKAPPKIGGELEDGLIKRWPWKIFSFISSPEDWGMEQRPKPREEPKLNRKSIKTLLTPHGEDFFNGRRTPV